MYAIDNLKKTYRNSANERNGRHNAVGISDVNGTEVDNVGARDANDHGEQGREPHTCVADAEKAILISQEIDTKKAKGFIIKAGKILPYFNTICSFKVEKPETETL